MASGGSGPPSPPAPTPSLPTALPSAFHLAYVQPLGHPCPIRPQNLCLHLHVRVRVQQEAGTPAFLWRPQKPVSAGTAVCPSSPLTSWLLPGSRACTWALWAARKDRPTWWPAQSWCLQGGGQSHQAGGGVGGWSPVRGQGEGEFWSVVMLPPPGGMAASAPLAPPGSGK